MKDRLLAGVLSAVVFLTLVSTAMASTWYVNGVSGSDRNNCKSSSTACKTISHAISLAASGGAISVAPATYVENLTIRKSVTILGSGASTTIVDGGGVGQVVSISPSNVNVTLSGMTFRHGRLENQCCGAGIANSGTLTVSNSIISGNAVNNPCTYNCSASGGGIQNSGRLIINNSAVSGNAVNSPCKGTVFDCRVGGGGISNVGIRGVVTIRNSTISGNGAPNGSAVWNLGTEASRVIIINCTVSGNRSPESTAAIWSLENNPGVTISNSTIARNYGLGVKLAKLQNSIVAYNSPNCFDAPSKGYNLSSDRSCAFKGPGDLNNIDPMLGPLRDNGGPTRTMALPSGSPAVDAGNPSGCTDGFGHLLKTDQRGMPRPDAEDTRGCDMGAYERQQD